MYEFTQRENKLGQQYHKHIFALMEGKDLKKTRKSLQDYFVDVMVQAQQEENKQDTKSKSLHADFQKLRDISHESAPHEYASQLQHIREEIIKQSQKMD